MKFADKIPYRASFRWVNNAMKLIHPLFTPGEHHTGYDSRTRSKNAVSGFWHHPDLPDGKCIYICTDCLPIGSEPTHMYFRLADNEKDYTGYWNHTARTVQDLADEVARIIKHHNTEPRF